MGNTIKIEAGLGAVRFRDAWALYKKLDGVDKQLFDEQWEFQKEQDRQKEEEELRQNGKDALAGIQTYLLNTPVRELTDAEKAVALYLMAITPKEEDK